jgi:Fe-S cluster assembly protein SufD
MRELPGPAWLRAFREEAFERFASAARPTEADELWRYSPIDELDLDEYAPAARAPGSVRLPEDAGRFVAVAGTDGPSVLTVDGRLEHVGAKGPVRVVSLAEDGRSDGVVRLGSVGTERDAFVALADAFCPDPTLIEVARGARLEDPIVVAHLVGYGSAPAGRRPASFPRTVVSVGEDAAAVVLEVVVSPDQALLCAPVVELAVADGASLGYVGVQALGRKAWQLGYQASRIGAGASLVALGVALGGRYARLRTDSLLAGRGGTSRLLACYFGDGEQVQDFRTLQDHAAPQTTSDLVFKGAVKDRAHSVYSGLIRVRHGAVGTNAFQTNRNLVLSEGARADSVPNLDISENDVRCSHASAVGPIDEEQRYYLETRGIAPDVAERLIVLGFFDDLLEQAPIPGLAPVVRAELARRLAKAGVA